MKLISLQSGSNGNCIYVEAGGVRLLFDAGISGKRAQERLATHNRDIGQVDALIISHDHRDHSRSMGIFQRKFGMPIYVTQRIAKWSRLWRRSAMCSTDSAAATYTGRRVLGNFGTCQVETGVT